MRVLVFEDTYDIEALLTSEGVDLNGVQLTQQWDSSQAISHIIETQPDVLLLDFFMPPQTGLEVLRALNKAVLDGAMKRPQTIIGISSEAQANKALISEGADRCVNKFDVPRLGIWTFHER
jgi:two-component system response regulator RstA